MLARSNRHRRFTIFDMMEAKGVFEENPANADSSDYVGPVEFPKMLYHPEGARRVIVPEEIIVTPLGPKSVGEQSELIWEIAEDADGEAKLRAAGWHDRPDKANAKARGEALPRSDKDE